MGVSKNSMIGNAGEYYVCAELCRRNILALITPKNIPLFDVVASDPSGDGVVNYLKLLKNNRKNSLI